MGHMTLLISSKILWQFGKKLSVELWHKFNVEKKVLVRILILSLIYDFYKDFGFEVQKFSISKHIMAIYYEP